MISVAFSPSFHLLEFGRTAFDAYWLGHNSPAVPFILPVLLSHLIPIPVSPPGQDRSHVGFSKIQAVFFLCVTDLLFRYIKSLAKPSEKLICIYLGFFIHPRKTELKTFYLRSSGFPPGHTRNLEQGEPEKSDSLNPQQFFISYFLISEF